MYNITYKVYLYYKLGVSINFEIVLFAFSYEGVSQYLFIVNHQSHRCISSAKKGLLWHKKAVIQY